jgi:hypothetical protein
MVHNVDSHPGSLIDCSLHPTCGGGRGGRRDGQREEVSQGDEARPCPE